jgi:hypothetical protein
MGAHASAHACLMHARVAVHALTATPVLPLPGERSSFKVIDLAGYCRMLEDLLELGTIGDCTDVFACMEADIGFLTSESGPKTAAPAPDAAAASGVPKPAPLHPSQLTILRACNSLMRRLSKVRVHARACVCVCLLGCAW